MDTETYERLKELYDKYGPQEFSKICQKFLAIAFKKAGYSGAAESERGVQGVDIEEVEKKGKKYSIEVKTTIKDYIIYEEKDEKGLQYKKEKNNQPILAILKLDIFEEWFFIKADNLKAGRLNIDSLRPYRVHELEKEISPFFDEAVKEHHRNTFNEGQEYLNRVLKERG